MKLDAEFSAPLEPEERALSRALLDDYGYFDFDDVSPELNTAVEHFQWALQHTTYFSDHFALSVPAWFFSGIAVVFLIAQVDVPRGSGRILGWALTVTFGSFIVGMRTLRGPLEKIASRLPGSSAPRRPWTSADSKPVTFLAIAMGGVAVLALMTNNTVAILTSGFMILNGTFFHSLRGPTMAGRRVANELLGYKKFLQEVEADPISRINSADEVPSQLDQKIAYAIAFHLDLGWGEQFVSNIADLIECADVLDEFGKA